MSIYPHLRLEREQPVNERRTRRSRGVPEPADIPEHARSLQTSLRNTLEAVKQDVGGFDERSLFKLSVGALSPEEIEKGFPGVEIVSQEEGGYALVFADDGSLAEFEARLSTLVAGDAPKYKQILYALQAFDRWSPNDRKGWALRRDGFPVTDSFLVDVELWPLSRPGERDKLLKAFNSWLQGLGATILDRVNSEGYLAFRLKVSQQQAEVLLEHRDVRTVDLPPCFGFEMQVLQLDIQDVGTVPSPANNVPLLAVLDSGIAAGHPLLAPAIGDAQGFIRPNLDAHDDNGHGTLVAGIALYDDVEECARTGQFSPVLRILSGRILDANAEADPRFIENIVEEAVRYFHKSYKCRVFNLSYGDINKPFLGGRVRGLAYTLDRLSRELDILFVVPTGNIRDLPVETLRDKYPGYLLDDTSKIIDPAPALNALTVGSLARWDKGVQAWRWPQDLAENPIARHDHPSPFSRTGLSVNGAVKPELVAYGGNLAIDPRTGQVIDRGLGELSTNHDFATGKLLSEDIGTSFAVPHVAHMAARLLAEMPNASANLLRTVLIANARVPATVSNLLDGDEDKIARTVGYGVVDSATLYRSMEEQVVLIAEATLTNDSNHFYEVPIPNSLYGDGKKSRRREITVAIAHSPAVRTTRVDYKASRLTFHLIEAPTLEAAVAATSKETAKQVKSIQELGCKKKMYGITLRSWGTAQASTWIISRERTSRLFLVVTRNDQPWAAGITKDEEPYALSIRISDKENENARLYTEIRTNLQVRQRARARARA